MAYKNFDFKNKVDNFNSEIYDIKEQRLDK